MPIDPNREVGKSLGEQAAVRFGMRAVLEITTAVFGLGTLFILWWQLGVAKEQLGVARDQELRNIRAYVGLDVKDTKIMNGTVPEQKIEVKNFGLSPAFGAVLGGRIVKLPYPLRGHIDLARDDAAVYSNPSLFPTQAINLTLAGDVLSQEDINAILDGRDYRLYILAHIEYNDIWGSRHFTHFCVGLVPGSVNQPPLPEYCDEYNDAN